MFEKYSAALQGIFKESAHKYLPKEAQKNTKCTKKHVILCPVEIGILNFRSRNEDNGHGFSQRNPSNDHRSSHCSQCVWKVVERGLKITLRSKS